MGAVFVLWILKQVQDDGCVCCWTLCFPLGAVPVDCAHRREGGDPVKHAVAVKPTTFRFFDPSRRPSSGQPADGLLRMKGIY